MASAPLLLALDTATLTCSVALHREAVLASSCTDAPRAHALSLIPMIAQLLAQRGRAPRDLDAVAVSMGPGSYTGLRIGVSAAKGLALAAGAALIGVPTLDAWAWAATAHTAPGDWILVAHPSRRRECYAALFRHGDAFAPEQVCPPTALPLASLREWMPLTPGRLWITGEASVPVQAALAREDEVCPPPADGLAPYVAQIAADRLVAGQVETIATFEPYYLKPFVAKKNTRSIYDRIPF